MPLSRLYEVYKNELQIDVAQTYFYDFISELIIIKFIVILIF
jgi:hypothetical protein